MVEFRVLGPVEVWAGDEQVQFQPLQALVLAALVIAEGPLPLSELLAVGWPVVPTNALNAVETCITRLRKRLKESGATTVVHTRDDWDQYILTGDDQTDIQVLRSLRARARDRAETGDWRSAMQLYREAMTCWRQEPFAARRLPPTLSVAVARLREEYLSVVTEYVDLVVEAGESPSDLVPMLRGLTGQWPDNQSLARRLAIALQTTGRANEALAEVQRIRARLRRETGLDLDPALELLHRQLLDPSRPAEPGTPHVPAPPRVLVGRQRDIDECITALRSASPAPVLVCGTPGIGKTVLAKAAATAARDDFPDGQIFVQVGPGITSGRLLTGLLRRVGIRGGLPLEDDGKLDLLSQVVEDRRYLVLFDNVQDEAQIRAALQARWAGVLLTSRFWLGGLDDVVRREVGALDQDNGQELLARLAPEAAASDRDGMREIVRLCAGLPLALRIAAGRLSAPDGIGPHRLAGQLADEHNRLDALQIGDLEVRATFRLAYECLSPGARTLFRHLGQLVSMGIVDVLPYVASAAVGQDVEGVDAAGAELLAAHLVEMGRLADDRHRYRLHDLIALFAVERFTEEERPAASDAASERAVDNAATSVARRVAQAYLEPALRGEQLLVVQGVHPCGRPAPATTMRRRPGSPGDKEVVDWLDAEQGNAAAAVAAARQAGHAETAAVLGRALMPVLEAGGHWDRWTSLAADARAAATDLPSPEILAAVDAGRGTLLHYRDDLEASCAALDAAVSGYRLTGDLSGVGYAQTMRAMSLRVLGRPARPALDEALGLGRALGDPVLEVEALRCLAWQDRDQGATGDAVARLVTALDRVQTVPGSERLRGYVLHDLGVARSSNGDLDKAREHLDQACTIFRAVSDQHWTALTLNRLGEVDLQADHFEQALQNLTEAVELFRLMKDRGGTIGVIEVNRD